MILAILVCVCVCVCMCACVYVYMFKTCWGASDDDNPGTELALTEFTCREFTDYQAEILRNLTRNDH